MAVGAEETAQRVTDPRDRTSVMVVIVPMVGVVGVVVAVGVALVPVAAVTIEARTRVGDSTTRVFGSHYRNAPSFECSAGERTTNYRTSNANTIKNYRTLPLLQHDVLCNRLHERYTPIRTPHTKAGR